MIKVYTWIHHNCSSGVVVLVFQKEPSPRDDLAKHISASSESASEAENLPAMNSVEPAYRPSAVLTNTVADE